MNITDKRKITGWESITVGEYKEIVSLAKEYDGRNDDITFKVVVLSNLYGVKEDEIWDLGLDKAGNLMETISFMVTPPQSPSRKTDKVRLGDRVYTVASNLNNFTYAQYVDFQNYYREEENLTDVLSVLLIPEGMKYGRDYDLEDVKKDIDENLPITTALSITGFFLNSLFNSIKHTLQYLEKKTKMMKSLPMKKTEREKEAIRKAMKQITRLQHMVGFPSSKPSATSPE